MEQLIVDITSACAVSAGIVGVLCLAAPATRGGASSLLGVSWAASAVWALAISLFVRAPFSATNARLLLTALCLVGLPWLLLALSYREDSVRAALSRWRPLLLSLAVADVTAAAVMWLHGVDWVTGIGSEPTIVVTRAGLLAAAVSAVPAGVAFALFTARSWSDVLEMPWLWVSAIGAIASLLWAACSLLWHGYVALHALVAADALGGVAAAVGVVAMGQTLPSPRPLVPSRRFVYGASVAGLIIAYLVAAHFAFYWASGFPARALQQVLPALAFTVVAALVIFLGSERTRHRLWVAVGQHLFRTKHDYGEAWIRLTAIVSTADTAAVLLQQTVAFCRELLCVPEVSVWLADAAGAFRRIVTASADSPRGRLEDADDCGPLAHAAASPILQLAEVRDAAQLGRITGASFSGPLLVNGRTVGVLAVGSSAAPATLDEEDRQVLRHVAAQVASSLGLFQLGEEIAETRAVRSLDRVSTFVLHDLKNLVAQQSFVLENAAQFGGDPRFVTDALAAFEDSTNRMRALIRRLHAKKPGLPIAGKQCDLLALVRDLLGQPQIMLPRGCRLHLELPADTAACVVPVDRDDLTQVLTNLLVNAAESLRSADGDVTVAIAPVAAGWQLTVRDTGCGIPAAFLRDKLFRAFHTTKKGGLGIGLYQCKTVIEASGGSITLTSREQVGTTATVVLPAVPRPPYETACREVEYGQTDAACR